MSKHTLAFSTYYSKKEERQISNPDPQHNVLKFSFDLLTFFKRYF